MSRGAGRRWGAQAAAAERTRLLNRAPFPHLILDHVKVTNDSEINVRWLTDQIIVIVIRTHTSTTGQVCSEDGDPRNRESLAPCP